jgi:hypothetical protein
MACFAVAAVLGAAGQYLYKSGADVSDGTIAGYLYNPRILGGAICYVGVMVLFVTAFRIGGALMVLYPIYASTFIWAALIAWWAYGSHIGPAAIGGMLLIVAGMFFLGQGGE